MQNIDFDTLPMLFCNGAHINYGQHQFVVALRSGDNIAGFAIPPELMKSMVTTWNEKLAEYEAKFGVIDTTSTTSGIESPFSM